MSARRALERSSSAIGVLVVLAAVLALAAGPASAERTTADFSLNPGQKVFWAGEDVDRAQVPSAELCDVADPCWKYRIEVRETSWRLRVALSAIFQDPGDVRVWADPPIDPAMFFDLQVEDPAGNVVASGSTHRLVTGYGVEVFAPAPARGIYTVTVIPRSVTDVAFRMRAKLEKAADVPTNPKVLLSPNLRAIPPFEFNFYTPTVTYGPGGGTPAPAASCMAEEIEEAIGAKFDPPEVCLRYSLGFENAGEGRLDLRWRGVETCPLEPDSPTTCELQQRRWYSDGNWDQSGSAGTAAFHFTHAHWHYQNLYEAQLFRVEGGQLQRQALGPGMKFGVLPGEEKMADWGRFWPACGPPRPDEDPPPPGSCQHDQDKHQGEVGLQAGWGDVYEWNRSGNYVAFPHALRVPKEGEYVLQIETNPSGRIVESDMTDNLAYAHIEVQDDASVRLIERGYGSDPWDPSKTVLRVAP